MKHTRSDGPTELTLEQKCAFCGWEDEFLDYPEGCDPWQISIDKLCDPWSEWDGLQEVVAEAQNSGDQSDA